MNVHQAFLFACLARLNHDFDRTIERAYQHDRTVDRLGVRVRRIADVNQGHAHAGRLGQRVLGIFATLFRGHRFQQDRETALDAGVDVAVGVRRVGIVDGFCWRAQDFEHVAHVQVNR